MRSQSREVNFRKDGTVKSIYDDVNGQPYKDYKFYRTGELKSEFSYRTNVKYNYCKCNKRTVDCFI